MRRRNCCNPLPHEHAARLVSPSQVIRSTYRRKNVKGGSIGLLFAKQSRTGPMKLASVHFRAAHFTVAQAKDWMRAHKLRPILFEAATADKKSSWHSEATRARRGRKTAHKRRRVA